MRGILRMHAQQRWILRGLNYRDEGGCERNWREKIENVLVFCFCFFHFVFFQFLRCTLNYFTAILNAYLIGFCLGHLFKRTLA